ncbi:solute carrier family 22 member 15 [Eurytemora carolleeae]|uniref:solute carrier family 22 member 15 n=1 Tax=Eurytemora carolleeae TaxID=1294199 RepID=UPI000C7664A2|nr:solute carrier family 22 member 15 [Eurytemora carolleeae]|eukprot:XP_023347368.1 solute carrier family 22 member 15-like [Eurytemora affinis]
MLTCPSELVGARYRGLYGITVMGAYPIGIMLMTGLAVIIQDWRSFTIMVSIIGCSFLGVNWYLVESPRWLVNVNRLKEAQTVLEVIRKGNGTSTNLISSLKQSSVVGLPRERIWNLVGRKRLTCLLYILCYIWFVNGATYYGLTLASGDIGTDLYTGMVLGGLAELPALVLCYIFFLRLGRRLGLALFMFFSGLSCILIQAVAGTSAEYLEIQVIFNTSIRNSENIQHRYQKFR